MKPSKQKETNEEYTVRHRKVIGEIVNSFRALFKGVSEEQSPYYQYKNDIEKEGKYFSTNDYELYASNINNELTFYVTIYDDIKRIIDLYDNYDSEKAKKRLAHFPKLLKYESEYFSNKTDDLMASILSLLKIGDERKTLLVEGINSEEVSDFKDHASKVFNKYNFNNPLDLIDNQNYSIFMIRLILFKDYLMISRTNEIFERRNFNYEITYKEMCAIVREQVDNFFEKYEIFLNLISEETSLKNKYIKKMVGNPLKNRKSDNYNKYYEVTKFIKTFDLYFPNIQGAQTKACELSNVLTTTNFSKWKSDNKLQYSKWYENISEEEIGLNKELISAYSKKYFNI